MLIFLYSFHRKLKENNLSICWCLLLIHTTHRLILISSAGLEETTLLLPSAPSGSTAARYGSTGQSQRPVHWWTAWQSPSESWVKSSKIKPPNIGQRVCSKHSKQNYHMCPSPCAVGINIKGVGKGFKEVFLSSFPGFPTVQKQSLYYAKSAVCIQKGSKTQNHG